MWDARLRKVSATPEATDGSDDWARVSGGALSMRERARKLPTNAESLSASAKMLAKNFLFTAGSIVCWRISAAPRMAAIGVLISCESVRAVSSTYCLPSRRLRIFSRARDRSPNSLFDHVSKRTADSPAATRSARAARFFKMPVTYVESAKATSAASEKARRAGRIRSVSERITERRTSAVDLITLTKAVTSPFFNTGIVLKSTTARR